MNIRAVGDRNQTLLEQLLGKRCILRHTLGGFFHAAYETICEKAVACSRLDFIKLCLNQSDIESDIEGELDGLFFERYFSLPLHKQTEEICQCYNY